MDFDAKMTMFHAQAERHVEAGEIDQALAMFIWLVDRVPSDFRHRMRIAEVLHQLGEDGMSSEVLQAVARQSAMCGRLMRTVAACKRGLALFPDQREDFEALLVRLHRRATRQDLLPLPPEDEDVEVVAPESPDDDEPRMVDASMRAGLVFEAHAKAMDFDEAGLPAEEEGDADLSMMPFFSDLSAREFVQVVEAMEVRLAEEGEAVMDQGDEGDSFFVLVRGELVIEREHDDGEVQELARLYDGALVGEMALLSRAPRSATVRAGAHSELFEVQRSVLDQLVEDSPGTARALVEFTKRRLLANLLSTSPLFTKFDRDTRREILSRFSSVLVEAGEVIVAEGDESHSLYLVSSGEFEVLKQEPGEDEQVRLATLVPGDVFGEISLLRNQPANATVMSLMRSVLLRLEHHAFMELAMQFPPVLEYLEQLTDERLAKNEEILSDDWVYGADDLVLV